MQELHIDCVLISLRKKAGITQEELAQAMGVSKSSVSKWESGATYPDITMLPKLAVFFNVTADELLNYTPQLTDEEINRIYNDLTKELVKDPKRTLERVENLTRQYYSCFQFLKEMSLFYINNCVSLPEPEENLYRALKLCQRIKENAKDPVLLSQNITTEAICYILLKQSEKAISLLEGESVVVSTNPELLCQAYQQAGNMEKGRDLLQVCIYQHLLFLIQDSMNYLMLSVGDEKRCEATLLRVEAIMNAYRIKELHPITAVGFYQSAMIYHLGAQKIEEALKDLRFFTAAMEQMIKSEQVIHGDYYFNQVNSWLEQSKFRVQAPRPKQIMLSETITLITQNPIFESIKETKAYKSCLKKLTALQGGE